MNPALLLGGAAVLTAYGVWSLTGRPKPSKAPRKRPLPASDPQGDIALQLWLLGSPLPARLLPALQMAVALLATGLAYVATHEAVIAVLLGTLGWYMPLSLLQSLAGRIWNQADDQAHTLANILQFALPVQGNPYIALRHALPDLAQPFQDWMRQVVAGETAGVPVEDGLMRLGLRLRHQELQLLAAILGSDRRALPSHELLAELLPTWTRRLRASGERRAKLAVAQTLSNLFIWGPMGLFLLLDALTPIGHVFQATVLGQGVAIAGMAAMVGAAHITRATISRERRLQTE